MKLESIGNPTLWGGFSLFILVMLILDLKVFHRESHSISLREALGWSIAWIVLALTFNFGIYHWYGTQKALEFLTGYLVEKALSVDNLFIFAVIFSYFRVPEKYQHRVLFYGILGAVLMRGVFIFLGTHLLQNFHWIMYVFGVALVVTGFKMLSQDETKVDPAKNIVFRLFKRFVPSIGEYHAERFFVKIDGKFYATLLFFVLIAVETTDLIFAIDSIPAIFAITLDPFIVFTSNIFAILGLRALYFLLASALGKLHFLKIGLSLVLIYIGMKMVITDWIEIPIMFSLIIVATCITGSIVASLAITSSQPNPPKKKK